jgi:hypothetical protein
MSAKFLLQYFQVEEFRTLLSTLPGIIAAVVDSLLARAWSIEEISP